MNWAGNMANDSTDTRQKLRFDVSFYAGTLNLRRRNGARWRHILSGTCQFRKAKASTRLVFSTSLDSWSPDVVHDSDDSVRRMATAEPQPGLRLRRKSSKSSQDSRSDDTAKDDAQREDVVWGKTPSGEGACSFGVICKSR